MIVVVTEVRLSVKQDSSVILCGSGGGAQTGFGGWSATGDQERGLGCDVICEFVKLGRKERGWVGA